MRGKAGGAHQIAFGVRAPVLRGRVSELTALLEDMGGATAGAAPRIPFAALHGVHFARLLVLEDATDEHDERLLPASLLFMSEVDAPLARHVAELADVGGAALDAAFGLCAGYPEAPTPAARRAFLLAHRLAPQAAYVNTVGRTRAQIEDEERLRQSIAGFLDAHGRELPDAQAARAAIQRFVRAEPSLAWACRRAPHPPLAWRARETLHALGFAAALVLATPLLALVLPLWALVLRYHEARDAVAHVPVAPEHERRLAALEDHVAQNQFSAVGFVKPGWFRRTTIQAVLWLLDYASRHVFNRGDLSGIKTIHFARWTVLDGWRRAIFTSNYDGSLESYMDDFIDKVAYGLNASFSHGVNYPRTFFLFFSGAKREEEFKDFLRNRQVPTQVWYSAYDRLTARNIANNALIRSGLFGALTDAEAQKWLRRL